MKTVFLAFGTIFLAELGDKTQLAVLAMKSKGYSSLEIFLGTMLAFAFITGIAVLFGAWLNEKIPGAVIQKTASVVFVLIGILMWFEKM